MPYLSVAGNNCRGYKNSAAELVSTWELVYNYRFMEVFLMLFFIEKCGFFNVYTHFSIAQRTLKLTFFCHVANTIESIG